MKDISKRIAKVLSFLLAVAMIFVMVQSYIPMQIAKESTDSLETKQAMAATQIGKIDNWMYRVDSYVSRIGRKLSSGKEEQKWMFNDTTKEYKNLYCIQSGNAQAEVYYIYSLYSISDDENMINKYFGNRETYNHFMWILENMYVSDTSDPAYMESRMFKNLSDNGYLEGLYKDMQDELQRLYNNAGVKSEGYTEHFTEYHFNGKNRVASDYTYAINGRDNFLKVIQNYLLLSYAKQRNGGYGLSPIDANGNITLDLRTYSNDYAAVKDYIGNDTSSKKFVHQLLLYLVKGFSNDSYNINKYKNFENDAYVNTKIDSSNVKYNSDTHRAGPFVVYNKYGFDITLSNVSYGSRVFNTNEYKVVDANGNEVNLSKATEKTEFYVEVNADFAKNATDTMNVNWNIDFGEVPEAKIFIPATGTTTQVLIDVERTHRTSKGSWGDVIPDLKADIALKKYIYSVNGNNVADRLGSIDLTNLKENKTPHNATYNMNKTAVSVNVGDTVTYAIRLFNEGEIDGTASKITDHLPNYLNFVKAYSADGTELEVEKTNYNKDITITTKLDKMKAFSNDDTEESFKAKSQVIYVECTVDSNKDDQKVYTNMAEIAEYTFERGSDIDSKASNWTIGTTDRSKDEWIDYSNNQDNWLDDNMHPFVGQEDDDDFDKIKVRKIDLALTKRIEGKIKEDGSEEYLVSEDSSVQKTKLEISGYEDIKLGKSHDLTYNMNKKPAIVSRGDKLITVITVYNEGLVDGVVKQITDYLPAGLNFNEAESNKLNDNVSFTYNQNSRQLVISVNGNTGVSLKNLNSFNNDVDKYEVRIVTDVDQGANGILYNSAQITDYGYVGNDGNYYKADVPNVDIDSNGSTSGDVVINKHRSAYMAAEMGLLDLTNMPKKFMDHEDDDDVDAVKVVYNPEFDLSLRKYVYKVEKNFKWTDGSNYTITYDERVPSLNERSVTALNSEGTAEYYHDKLKVNVEEGDLVTYRIRVYNEGIGEAYDGRATQVTDYLPEGVEFVGLESGYETEWKATANGQVITFDYIGDTIIEANSIAKMAEPHRGKNDYYQEIGLVCKVTASTNLSGKALTNRAAITGDEAYDNGKLVEGVQDKDSNPDGLTNPDLDNWYDKTVTNEDTPDEYYPGEEDDDDFDTIYVDSYTVDFEKTDGEDTLSGVDFKVYKVRYISYPVQRMEPVELEEVEDKLKETGKATFKTVMPSTGIEKDYYVVKEIKADSDYINPFDGKYIAFYMYNSDGEMVTGSWSGSQSAKGFIICEDDGDDNYFNDKAIDYNDRDESTPYKFATLNAATGAIKLTMVNTKIVPEGKFNVKLHKVDEDGNLIKDYSARFEGHRHNGKINIEYIDVKTENGVATIDENVEIEDVKDHYQYQIKETEAPEGYEKELRLLVLNVDFKRVDNKYVLDTEKTTFNLGSDEISLSDTDGFSGDKNASWYIDEETATINIYLKNTPEVKPEGKFNVKLHKVDEDGNLIKDYSARFEGHRHNGKINIEYIDVKTENGVATIDKDVEITDVNDHYQYQIEETEAPEGYEKELRMLVLNIDFKQADKKYVIDTEKTTFNLGSDVISLSDTDGFSGDKNASWYIDEDTATINIYLKNEKVIIPEGNFSVKLYKADEDGNLIKDYSARFEGTRHNGKINIGYIDVKTKDGVATIDEKVEIEDVKDHYQYQIKETEAPEGYEKELRLLVLNVDFKQVDNKYVLDTEKTTFNLGSDEISLSEKDGEFIGENSAAWFIDEETATISIYLKNKPKVRSSGDFSVKLYKVDEKGNLITNYSAKFEGMRHNGKINVKNIKVETVNGIATIDENVVIEDINDSYKYMINETEAPVGFKKVLETLVLTMNFKEVGTKRIIDTENTVFNFGSTVVAPSSEAGVFDNNETASWFIDEETATINIYLKNERDSRTFNLNLVKRKDVDNNNDGTNDPLAGAEFKITIDDGKGNVVTKEGLTTDKNGRIPTISDIAIEDENVTYTVTVEETKAPEGYIGLDKPVTFTAKSTIKDNVYVLEPVEMSALENEARISREIKADEIYIEAENRAVPVIHKGVKTVENQNSGYDKNEIQTWVINTTVPYGIKDYTKYVVTDTIDYQKSKVEEKRIEFINEDKPEENVVVKYKGTETVLEEGKDYYVFFDKDTKVLVVTFINNDFEGGKSLKEGTKLEITFKTKFTLDENGNIKGLNQAIPNTSHLTYGVNGKEDTAKSETPEVHTGGVGVFKYDEVSGKALEGAHFKIARSEEDARDGKFIKLRDENGNETEEDYEVISDVNGHAEFVGLEFGEDAEGKVEASRDSETGATVYTYDWTKAATTYYIVETEAPEEYNKITDVVPAVVTPSNYNNLDLTKYIEIGNRPKEYDLALRKYITNVKAYDHDGNVIDRNITDREPRVTITDEFKNKEVTTAIYEHTKEPVIVQQGNIVTYNIRVYNEGPEDAYASLVKDDIPEGTEFVAYTEGDGSINDKYDWELLDADGNKTSDVTKAKYITTRCLASGEENLIKAFDPDTMNELDFRTVQVQFKVTEPNTSERILTNYAQISEITNAKGKVVTDRDSTPDEWIEGEDDQDIENIKLLYFDLALRKWVTKAIVYENGQEVVYETGHHAEDDPEDVVKVDLKKSKLSSIVVKFEYQIRVTNEGKIGGSATEVTDHIPEGLVFDEADNTIWTKVDDNTIVTDALKDTYLEPGESAEVTVVLRWVNSASNLGIKNNIAEISKDYNEYGVADIDSTPGNYKWGEDDIDDAPVMLAIKTGSIATQCVALGVAVLFILVFGVKGIKKSFKEI